MKLDYLKGCGVAMVTPFREDNSIDWDAHGKITDYVIEGGIQYLVVIGTTGESVTLKPAEKQELIRRTIEFADGRVPVVAGFGGNDTASVVEDLKSFDLDGVAAILSVSPAYNKPTQEGIFAHFSAIAGATDLPIILYNVPGRTSSNMLADTTIRLAREFENIVAIKEATYDLEQITYLACYKPDDFYLLSGCDDLIFHEMGIGFDGVISVAGNVIPNTFNKMVRLCQEDRFLEAGEIHKRIYPFIFSLFAQGNPAGAKAAFHHLGLCDEHVRQPLIPVSRPHYDKIAKEIEAIRASLNN